VTALPPALAPWAVELEQLPRDLALGLYPLIARLASALGSLSARALAASPEPDGYEGLGRRGPYTRLLPSEWLLAWEMPDEFLRRAASAEHAFLQLKHAQLAGTRRSLLLFDSGPQVLGAPRIVQLALLIVLARRARAAGAELAFGVLQGKPGSWSREVTPAGMVSLLETRCAREASQYDAQGWLEQIGPLQRSDDLWLLGGRDLERLAELASWPRVVLEEPLACEERIVSVRVLRADKHAVALTLELPPPSLCARLLRDPLSAARAPARPASLPFDELRPIAFAGDGRRVQVWLQGGTMATFPVPNSPRATPGKVRTFTPRTGEQLIGFGSFGRRLMALTRGDGHFYTQNCGAEGPDQRTRAFVIRERGLPGMMSPGQILASGRERWFLTDSGELYAIDRPGTRLERVARTVAAAVAPGGGLLRAFAEGANLVVGGAPKQYGRKPIAELTTILLPGVAVQRVLFGHGWGDSRCVALVHDEGPVGIATWPKRGLELVNLPRGASVRGVITCDGEPCVVLLDADCRVLRAYGQRLDRELARPGSEIAQVAASASTQHVAYLTRAGELVVYSLLHHEVVLRVRAEPQP
jgi:hypothetical protein